MKTRIVISALFLFSLLGLYGCEQQAPDSPTMDEQPGQFGQPEQQPNGGMQPQPDQPGEAPQQPGSPGQQQP